jgi:hypothetical protein
MQAASVCQGIGAGGAARAGEVVGGPETFRYRELAVTIGEAMGEPRTIVSMPPSIAHAARR